MSSIFKVSIVGKANVGKSTLFNKFAREKSSITLDRKGVTRDVLIKRISTPNGKNFLLLDTAGFNPAQLETIERTEYAIKESDLILFMIDNKIDSEDMDFASWLRKNARKGKIVLVCNKTDCKDKDDASIFGFENVFSISAEHSVGLGRLLAHIESLILHEKKSDVLGDDQQKEQRIKIAIIGQPNVGKSTLMNRFLGKDRVLVSPIAGTTRDAVNDEFKWRDRIFEIIDTAGLRKKHKVTDALEKLSNSKALKASSETDLVIFMYDVSHFTLERQDFRLINRILEQGKPIILLGNKKDEVSEAVLTNIEEFIKLQSQKLVVGNIPMFFISSLHETDFSPILDACCRLYLELQRTIPTHRLNKWLQETIKNHPHPIVNSKSVKLKYIKKVWNKFVFTISANRPECVSDSYLNYIRNSLIRDFKIYGIPLKFSLKKNNNPYLDRSGTSERKGTSKSSSRGNKVSGSAKSKILIRERKIPSKRGV